MFHTHTDENNDIIIHSNVILPVKKVDDGLIFQADKHPVETWNKKENIKLSDRFIL